MLCRYDWIGMQQKREMRIKTVKKPKKSLTNDFYWCIQLQVVGHIRTVIDVVVAFVHVLMIGSSQQQAKPWQTETNKERKNQNQRDIFLTHFPRLYVDFISSVVVQLVWRCSLHRQNQHEKIKH